MTGLFWGIHSGMDSSAASSDAARAKGEARSAIQQVQDLEARLDRALLASEAMWTLLRDKLGVTDEELVARINEVDLADGQADGKAKKPPVSCPTCGRTIARRFPKCMYCGQQVMQYPFV